jgi:hypothetical protein
VAKVAAGVLQPVGPLELQRVEVGVGQVALGRRGRQRPRLEPAARAERTWSRFYESVTDVALVKNACKIENF